MQQLVSYPHPLRKCHFIKRYKRFFVDVLLDNGAVEAVHCANSGSMKSCLIENTNAYTLDSFNEKRKLRHSLELLQLPDGLACLNTSRANEFIEKVLQHSVAKDNSHFPLLNSFHNYNVVGREVKFSPETRFDFCLTATNSDKKAWIEVKSVSLCLEPNFYSFPDAVTTRGQKHLNHLMEAKTQGHEAFLFFVVMRGGNVSPQTIAKNFKACSQIDPTYAKLLDKAKKEGVKVFLFVPEITLDGFGLRDVFQI